MQPQRDEDGPMKLPLGCFAHIISMKVLTGVLTGSIAFILVSLSIAYYSSSTHSASMETASIPEGFPSTLYDEWTHGLEFDIDLNSDKYKHMTESVMESVFCDSSIMN